jgi:hypothetical protein
MTTDDFDRMARAIARGVVKATGDDPHECALLLRRAIVYLERRHVPSSCQSQLRRKASALAVSGEVQ